jgi:phosphoribosylformylglycinamidine cyclo-ligase
MAGFCTGIVDKKKVIDGSAIKPSDRVIGLASSGLHSNGYSMVNYLLTRHQIFYADHPELLTPTTIYAPVVKRLLDEGDWIYGMSHITGGGIPENLPRCLPEGLTARVDYNAWTVPEIFKKIQLKGNVDEEEMKRVFNLGIGYCVVVPANRLELTMDIIRDEGIECWEIGEVYE